MGPIAESEAFCWYVCVGPYVALGVIADGRLPWEDSSVARSKPLRMKPPAFWPLLLPALADAPVVMQLADVE